MNLVPDWTMVPMWFVFFATVLMLNTLVFKPTMSILAERKKRTEGSDKEVHYFNDQSQIKMKEYSSLMLEARNLAREARDEILKEADHHQKEIINEARVFSEGALSKARDQIQSDALTARNQLKTLVGDLSDSIKNKVIDRKVA